MLGFRRHFGTAMVMALFVLVFGQPLVPVALASPGPLSTSHSSASAPAMVCPPDGCGGGGGDPFFGANFTWMQNATRFWPQQQGNWCGVSDIEAMNLYDWYRYNGNSNPQYEYQQDVANHLNSNAAISPWGLAYSHNLHSPAFKADIAADSGTDPRSITWGIYDITPPGYYFHNYNYSENDNSTADSATYQVASDFGPHNGVNNPVSVTIWGGRHSLIEDGVYATSDPSAGGERVDDIDLWDSAHGYNGTSKGYLFNYTNAAVSTYDWENTTEDPYGVTYWFWKTPYDTGWDGNYDDPDPWTSGGSFGATPNYYTVQNYDPSATLIWHWSHAWVSIEQDYVTNVCSGSPNYSLNRYGGLDLHNGSVACG